MSSLLTRFYHYQNIRFPVLVLALSLLPAIFSSTKVVGVQPDVLKIALAVIISIAYMLHIRIIDEKRDYEHDNLYHTDRPVQTGLISIRDLEYINIITIIILVVVSASLGFNSGCLAALMILYSFLAEKEFFIRQKIRQHFFIYNAMNLIQMLMLQVLIYVVLVGYIPLNYLVFVHFAFTTIGTVVYEYIRKVKIPGSDGQGKDSYTWYLGFNGSVIIYLALALVGVYLFLEILRQISGIHFREIVFGCIFGLVLTLTAVTHLFYKKNMTDSLLKLSFFITYAAMNLIIYEA